jgi:acyl-CoA synthetase (AMP-forming)/AMP-acid ligase II
MLQGGGTAKRVIGRILDVAVSAVPNRIAATLGDEALTFRECDRRANRAANALQSLGVARGQRLMFWSDISLTNLDIYIGTLRLGATYVPLNPDFSEEEARDMIAYVRPHLLVVDQRHVPVAEGLAREAKVPLAVIDVRGTVPGVDLDARMKLAADTPPPGAHVEDEDIEAMFLTSGSTGKPKAVMVSHRASWLRATYVNATNSIACGGAGEVCMFPLYHFAGWTFLLASWAHYRAIHLTYRTDADTLLGLVERRGASSIYCIPAVWERILACKNTYRTGSLLFASTGTSRVEPDLLERVLARFPGVRTSVNYGSTEFGRGLSLDHSDLFRKPYSVGLPQPGAEACIIDGEVCLRGETLMSGYYELPQQTADVWQDGWYRSGDLGEQDDEGYFWITGRRREIIRSGGETIAPEEVELALASFPGVREVAVVGLPDTSWGEVICAVLVLEQGCKTPEVEELRRHVSTLAAFKHPRKVVVFDSIPRTAAMDKPQRARIRDTILGLG